MFLMKITGVLWRHKQNMVTVLCIAVISLMTWTISTGNGYTNRVTVISISNNSQTLSPVLAASSDNKNFFQSAMMYGKRRQGKAFLTIGIPTMKRPANATYLWNCLDSLLNNSNEQQKNETVIVIFLSDFETDLKWEYASNITKRYSKEIDSGLIQLIQAPREFYPSLDNLKRNYGHPIAKVKWRSKQNIDYAFMMKYSLNLSDYYLQLEDDVTTVPGYMDKIKTFMTQQKRKWVCLEFSSLGFIAKLYHSYDLKKLSDMLILFYDEQPNDFTYLHFNSLLTQFRRIILKPTIFQHHGFHSTLTIKKVRLKDLDFKDGIDSEHPLPDAGDKNKNKHKKVPKKP